MPLQQDPEIPSSVVDPKVSRAELVGGMVIAAVAMALCGGVALAGPTAPFRGAGLVAFVWSVGLFFYWAWELWRSLDFDGPTPDDGEDWHGPN